MMGKLSKMADGRMMTHASASEVNMNMLGNLKDVGASEDVGGSDSRNQYSKGMF